MMTRLLSHTCFVIALVSGGCTDPEVQARTTQSTAATQAEVNTDQRKTEKASKVPKGKHVTIHRASGEPLHIKVELARTEPERVKGLMFRENLPSQTGMLFLMDRVANHRFWMKNTLIALDMVFFDGEGHFVSAQHHVPPLTLMARRSAAPAQYVLELNAGEVDALGISMQTLLALPFGQYE